MALTLQTRKTRVLTVIQRYGSEIVGGELLCRHVMERLKNQLNITILTTCARDYVTWKNVYSPGVHRDGNIRIVRCPVRYPRWVPLFNLVNLVVLQRRIEFQPPSALQRIWAYLQGPYSPSLLSFLSNHHHEYEVILFFTYLYFHTIEGLPKLGNRSILVPFAHDERPIYLGLFRKVFQAPRALIYLTVEEQQLVNRLFLIENKPQRIASMRVPTFSEFKENGLITKKKTALFRTQHGLHRPYFLYLGRIDPSKGANVMFYYFERYSELSGRKFDLVLAGQKHMPLPKKPYIKYLGYLSEPEKVLAFIESEAFVLLSPYESYSIALLESLGLRRPAIVNGRCPVLRGHIERSQVGFAVTDYSEFHAACDAVLQRKNGEMGLKGEAYVKKNFSWTNIERAYLDLIDLVASNKSS